MTYTLSLPRIVVGVDGSAALAAAVRWAVREARLRHATVHLVCAYHGDARLRAPYASSSWAARLHQRRAAARAVLDLATEAASRHLPPERLISELAKEPPALALLDRAADAEMLVLGTTRPDRRPGQPPPAMGPVARTCLRLAHCPVVIVAPDEPPTGQGAGRRRGTLARSRERPSAPPPTCPCRSVGTCPSCAISWPVSGPRAPREQHAPEYQQTVLASRRRRCGPGAGALGRHGRRVQADHRTGPARCRADNGCGAGRGRPDRHPVPAPRSGIGGFRGWSRRLPR